MPTNLYGPGDNYDLETSHVLPALIRKFHEAKIRHLGTVPFGPVATRARAARKVELVFPDHFATPIQWS